VLLPVGRKETGRKKGETSINGNWVCLVSSKADMTLSLQSHLSESEHQLLGRNRTFGSTFHKGTFHKGLYVNKS